MFNQARRTIPMVHPLLAIVATLRIKQISNQAKATAAEIEIWTPIVGKLSSFFTRSLVHGKQIQITLDMVRVVR